MNNNSEIVWACPLTRTGKKSKAKDAHAKCAQEFANENHFELIHTANNGDCFFNTLTRFALLTNNRELLKSTNNIEYDAKYDMEGHPNDLVLRDYLVNHMEENLQDYIAFINNSRISVENQLDLLRKGGLWDTDIGDLVVPVGANAFGININLYNIEENEKGHDIIKLTKYVSSYYPSDVYVNIMRINDGHFELLLPFPSKKRESRNQVEEKNNSDCTKKAIEAAKISTEAAIISLNYAKKISNNKLINTSLHSNETNVRKMANKLEQLSISNNVGAKPRRSSHLSKKESIPTSTRLTRSMSRATQKKKMENQNALNKSYASLNNSYKPSTKRSTRKKKVNNINYKNNYNNNYNNNMRAAIEASLRNQK